MLVFLLANVAVSTPVYARDCQRGQVSHPASQSEAEILHMPMGTDVCPADVAVGINNISGEAYQYLYSISTKSDTADLAHVHGLNSTFAICSANFLKAFTQKYGGVQVTSTWRSADDQHRVSTSPTSNHTRGLALDVHPASHAQADYDRLRDFAIANKQFGVCFARPTYNDAPDRPHMTAAGIGSRTENCDQFGITRLCDEGGTFDPNQVHDAVPTQQSPLTPTVTAALTDGLRKLFSPEKPQPQTQPQLPSTPLPSASQPTSAFNPPPPSSDGNNGNAGNTNSSGPTAGPSPAEHPTITTPPPAISDLLTDLALPTMTASTTATGTPIALIHALNNTTSLAPEAAPEVQSAPLPQPAQEAVSPTPHPQPSTFITDDLKDSSQQAYAPTAKNTFIFQTLETLKQILLKAIALLQPFRGLGRTAHTTTAMME